MPSVRQACEIFELSETCYRYQSVNQEENAQIAKQLVKLTEQNKTWGFKLCYLHIRNVQGLRYNHKRVYRIYKELG